MKRLELIEALESIKGTLTTNPIIPILSHFCFNDTTIETSNGVQGMRVNFKTGIKATVPGPILLKMLKSLPNEEITLDSTTEGVNLKAGKTKVSFNIFEVNNFPSAFKYDGVFENEDIFLTNGTNFIEAIKKCATIANKDIVRENQNGVTLKDNICYGTNNAIIMKYPIDFAIKAECLLPLEFCSNAFDGTLKINKEYAYLFNSTLELASALKPVKLLDFEKVLSNFKFTANNLYFITDEMRKAVARASLILSDSRYKVLYVEPTNNEICLRGSSEISEIDEVLNIKARFDKFKISIDDLNKIISEISMFGVIGNEVKTVLVGTGDNLEVLVATLA